MTIAANLTENSSITASFVQSLTYHTGLTENTAISGRIVQQLKYLTALSENTSISSQIAKTIAFPVALTENSNISIANIIKQLALVSNISENSNISARIIQQLIYGTSLTENTSVIARLVKSLTLKTSLAESSLIQSMFTSIKYFQAALSESSQSSATLIYIKALVAALSETSSIACEKLVNLTFLFLHPFSALVSSSTANFELIPQNFDVTPDLDWNVSPRLQNMYPIPDTIVSYNAPISFDIENVPMEDITAYAHGEKLDGRFGVTGLENFVITKNPNIARGFTCTGNLPVEFTDGLINIVVRATTVDHGISVLVGKWQYRVL